MSETFLLTQQELGDLFLSKTEQQKQQQQSLMIPSLPYEEELSRVLKKSSEYHISVFGEISTRPQTISGVGGAESGAGLGIEGEALAEGSLSGNSEYVRLKAHYQRENKRYQDKVASL